VTGKDDVISDGVSTIIVSNGHPLLGKITGVTIIYLQQLTSSPVALSGQFSGLVSLWIGRTSFWLRSQGMRIFGFG
jgi:hypothetical protein